MEGGLEVRFSAAPDRLRGGVVFLYRGATVDWRLERAGWDASADARSVVDLTALPASPIGRLKTNENEALIPLEDGTLADIPLAASEIRIVGPVADGPAEAVEVVLRLGQSAGGLLFVPRAASGIARRCSARESAIASETVRKARCGISAQHRSRTPSISRTRTPGCRAPRAMEPPRAASGRFRGATIQPRTLHALRRGSEGISAQSSSTPRAMEQRPPA